MPDITKCSGERCPWRLDCYRYSSPSSEYQSFFVNVPGKRAGPRWTCVHFWPREQNGCMEHNIIVQERQ
jgi:hypothetical protein